MKRKIALFLIAGTALLLSGCWDYREINDTAMVSGISIDRGEEKSYLVSVEIIKPAESDSATSSAKVLSEEGNSVEDCLKRLVNVATKELQFSHCKLILFSEEVAKEGVSDLVDFFLRDPEYRADLYIAVVSGADASEMLSTGEKEERVCSFEYASVIENSYVETGSVPPTKLYQFPMDGELSLLPAFEKKEEQFSVSGVRGFRNGVQFSSFDLPFSQSILLVSGEYRMGELLLTARDGTEVPCQVRSVKTKKDVNDSDGLAVTAEIKCNIRLTTLPEGFDISTKEAIKRTEAEISRLLMEKIKRDWETALSGDFEDVFGLGVYLYRHAPRKYQEWKDSDSEGKIEFNPSCSVVLENSGYSEERIAG